jgi:hypothetical protein
MPVTMQKMKILMIQVAYCQSSLQDLSQSSENAGSFLLLL